MGADTKMRALKQEEEALKKKEEAAQIMAKASAKAVEAEKAAGTYVDAAATAQEEDHVSALEDMETVNIEALASSPVSRPLPPSVSPEEAQKQVRADFEVDEANRAAATREARDMIAKERAEAMLRAAHAAKVHEIANDSPEQKEHEDAAVAHQLELQKLETSEELESPSIRHARRLFSWLGF